MRTNLLRALLPVLLVLGLALACSDRDETEPAADAGIGADSGLPADSGTPASDAGGLPDSGQPADGGGEPADAGQPDAGGPIESCADLNAVRCFSNLDCEEVSDVCRSFSEDGVLRCCVPGARGTGDVGTSCTSDDQCLIGRCLERDDGARFCSGACESDLECPTSMECKPFFGWCVPRDTTAPPENCEQAGLASQCFEHANCDAGERCENVGTEENEVLCCALGERGTLPVGSECTDGVECAYGRCLGGLCSDYCDMDTDPCPPETMICSLISNRCEPL